VKFDEVEYSMDPSLKPNVALNSDRGGYRSTLKFKICSKLCFLAAFCPGGVTVCINQARNLEHNSKSHVQFCMPNLALISEGGRHRSPAKIPRLVKFDVSCLAGTT